MAEKFCMIEIRDVDRIHIWNGLGYVTGPWALANRQLVGEDYDPADLSGEMAARIEVAISAASFPADIPFLWEGDEMVVDSLRDEAMRSAGHLRAFARWIVSLDDPDGPGFEARRTVTMAQIIGKAREALALPEE